MGAAKTGAIRAGVGGWTFEPWRGVFFPPKLPHARELAHASRQLTAIEINGTFYRTQTPASFRKWREETPDGFVFSLKAPRYATNRKVLADAGESIGFFTASGIEELGPKLGPILWQFAPTKKFDPDDFGAFCALLPREHAGAPLRHALEVRHESFQTPEFVALARKHGHAIVLADHDSYPEIADLTADFVYLRLQRCREDVETGYPAEEIARWSARARRWSRGGDAPELSHAGPAGAPETPRDVFLFFISGAKVRAPAAAVATIEDLARQEG